MFSHHIFFVGVAVQFLVAFAGAIVLTWFGRAVTRLVEALAPRPLPRLAVLRVRSVAQPFRPVNGETGFDRLTASLLPRYCNVRKATIYAGSNEIQRNIIAKATLGL